MNPWGRQVKTVSVTCGIAALTWGCAGSAIALDVQFNPPSPRLGDTISVTISPDNQTVAGNVQVQVGQETYNAFPIAGGRFRAFIPTTPLEAAGRRNVRVTDGATTRNLAINVGKRTFRIQRINLPPGKAGVKATETELRRAREFRAVRSPEKFWTRAFIDPSRGRKSTPYGVRRYYNGVFAKDYYHRGLDYAAPSGAPVVAPAPGRVILVGRVVDGFRVHGNTVGIDHGQGVASILIHLRDISVKEGDFVQVGQKVGTVGSTGASTGPHLHWGLYVNGKSIDPVQWLKTNLE